MESGTLYGDFMVNLIWRLFGNLICHKISIESVTLHTISIQSPY